IDRSAPMLAKLVTKRAARPVAAVRGDGARPRSAGGVAAVRGDGTRLPLADASVDAAVAVHVFHLIPGWRAVLAELARVLRPGGLRRRRGDARCGLAARARSHRVAVRGRERGGAARAPGELPRGRGLAAGRRRARALHAPGAAEPAAGAGRGADVVLHLAHERRAARRGDGGAACGPRGRVRRPRARGGARVGLLGARLLELDDRKPGRVLGEAGLKVGRRLPGARAARPEAAAARLAIAGKGR